MAAANASIAAANGAAAGNHRPETVSPIIGILCIDVSHKLNEIYGPKIKSYIAASYVKWVEGAGGRVVPIWIGREKSYYAEIMGKINGILIPGGAVFFSSKYITSPEMRNDCVQSSKFIYEIAVEKNENKEFFPIWGTCLGMELLLLHSAQGVDPRQDCSHMNCPLPVVFTKDFRRSRLFQNLSTELEKIMETEPFGYHFHRYCITEEDLLQFKIHKDWHVLATNKDENGIEFISIIEHQRYPFYGVQFHPEKVRYEQHDAESDKCCHSPAAIKAVQYLADFFVQECRKSENRFGSYEEELTYFIWNFEATYTGRHMKQWMQCYMFDEAPDYANSTGH